MTTEREIFRRIGRIIKAACPAGTGFAAVIDGHYLSSADRADVGRLLAGWLHRQPRLSTGVDCAVFSGPLAGEPPDVFAARHKLETQCVAIAESVFTTFRDRGRPVTLVFFLFEFGGRQTNTAYRILGSTALALRWITALARTAAAN